jgi:hypothetical protein
MPPAYRYLGFGLKIASETEFPEMFPGGTGDPDITIRLGIPDESPLPGHDDGKVWYEFLPDRFRLNIPDAGRYLALSGKDVHVDVADGAALATARVYVLTITMAALLMQRGRFLLHASGVVHEGRVHLFMGESGSGKSSLLAELRRRGYRAFTDDVCVLSYGGERGDSVMAHASYPMMKLLPESIEKIGDPRNGFGHRIWPDEEKYGQFFHEDFAAEPLPIGSVQILNVQPGHEGGYLSERATGVNAFRMLSENTYRRQFMREISLASAHAGMLSSLINQVPVRTLTRSAHLSDIPSFTDFTEALIKAVP